MSVRVEDLELFLQRNRHRCKFSPWSQFCTYGICTKESRDIKDIARQHPAIERQRDGVAISESGERIIERDTAADVPHDEVRDGEERQRRQPAYEGQFAKRVLRSQPAMKRRKSKGIGGTAGSLNATIWCASS